jgi:hypothetical protein
MKIKLRILSLCALTLIASGSARAALVTEDFNSGISVGMISGTFPVGTYFTGDFLNANAGDTVGGLTITLTVAFSSGGYGNGNMYAYLVSPNNTLVQLFGSQSGDEAYGIGGGSVNPFGNSGSGLNNVTLADSASTSIQNAPNGTITGTYQAMENLSAMNGSSANGNWTLFFTDAQSGGPAGTLADWSLGITAVPEPVTQALIIFGACILLLHLGRWCRTRLHRRRG